MDILIIEDELAVLNGMHSAVQSLGGRVGRIFAIGDAEAAAELIAEHRPEIIVTDIVLPQMSGLDLLEQIMDESYQPKVIVVSGYNDFAYAQRSIKLGAVDYMLKPFVREEFIRKVQSVMDMVDKEKETKLQNKQDSRSLLGTRLLRDKFIMGLCTNPVSLNENTVHRLKFFDMEWLADSGCTIIAVDRLEHSSAALTEREIELKVFAVGNVVEEILQQGPPSVIVQNIHHQWIILTSAENTDALTRTIMTSVKKYQRIDVCAGISSRIHSFMGIAEAYAQAVRAMKLALAGQGTSCLSYPDIAAMAEGDGNKIDFGRMAEFVYLGDRDKIHRAVAAKVHELTLTGETANRQAFVQGCLEWVVQVHAVMADRMLVKPKPISIQLWVDLEQCGSYEQIRDYLIQYFTNLSGHIVTIPMNPIIEKALAIMRSRYSEAITLQGLASELSVHPVWLSQLFKRETKITFSQQLTEIRMEEAKRLLDESNLKIYEIAEQAGYSDLQHFGQVFKARTGMTPKEYRSRHEK